VSRCRWPWSELDLDPTDDTGAIRRAYAKKLRALDPDRQADAFQRLRQAREDALHEAAFALEAPEAEFANDSEASGWAADAPPPDGFGSGQSDPLHAAVDDAPAAYEAPDELDRPYRRLVELLHPDPAREEPLSPDEEADLAATFDDILADPRLEEIAFFGETEDWLSQVLAAAIPWSDRLLPRVAERFGWLAEAGSIAQPPAVAAITDRLEALRFLDEVQSPRHPHHRAWRELTRPADEGSPRPWGSGRHVHELLHLVRARYPDLERHFDWYRVSMYESPPRFEAKGWKLAVGVWLLIALVRLFVGAGDPEQAPDPTLIPQVSASMLSSPQADIGYALETLFGDDLTLSELQVENVGLYALLESNWNVAREANSTRPAFAQQIGSLLSSRQRGALSKASYPILADHLRLRLDEAALARRQGWQACADFLSGTKPLKPLPEALARRGRKLVARTLLEVEGDVANPDGPPKRFLIPASVVEDVGRRTDLAPAAIGAALSDQGSAEHRCRARIALYQATLALPRREGLPLLRKL
jgi:curved DNA-binding protein CbpA